MAGYLLAIKWRGFTEALMKRTQFFMQNGDVEMRLPNGRKFLFWIPYTSSGLGYVRVTQKRFHSADDRQVCERLYGDGNTLMATPETLLTVIKREYRRRRLAEPEFGLRDDG